MKSTELRKAQMHKCTNAQAQKFLVVQAIELEMNLKPSLLLKVKGELK